MSVVVATGVGYGVASAGPSPSSSSAAGGASTGYSSTTIPSNLGFSDIAASPSGIVLSGSATQDGDEGVDCLTAKVDPTTLALSRIVEPKCDAVSPTGERVFAVQDEAPTMEASVRIARLTSSGHVELGPVIVRYTVLSDTHLESAEASGSLWLYAPDTPTGGRALRISEATGNVLQDTPVAPAMDRPVIAANANGLYLAPTSNTGFLGKSAANESGVIYHVGIGASGVQVFDPSSRRQFTGYVSWIIGDGDSLWADVCARPVAASSCVINRFDGTSARPVYLVSDHDLTGGWVVGDAAEGFYSAVSPNAGIDQDTTRDRIARVDPATGAVATIATIVLPTYWQGDYLDGWQDAALYGPALYLLAPPGSDGADTTGTLYRIPLPGHA